MGPPFGMTRFNFIDYILLVFDLLVSGLCSSLSKVLDK